ncbi:hypothetical protein FOVSG1_011334 [Fusarium oxysporum f. sp. vasinfectum]
MQSSPPTIFVDSLPKGSSVTFKDSTFFTHNGPGATFPSADQVRVKSEAGDHVLDRKNTVIFESLGLVVKFGKEPRVTVAEGQCLWWLRRHVPSVPVPEMYGWTEDGGEVFLYMQLVEVKRDSNDEFLGQINRGPLQDVVFADGIRP